MFLSVYVSKRMCGSDLKLCMMVIPTTVSSRPDGEDSKQGSCAGAKQTIVTSILHGLYVIYIINPSKICHEHSHIGSQYTQAYLSCIPDTSAMTLAMPLCKAKHRELSNDQNLLNTVLHPPWRHAINLFTDKHKTSTM